MRLFVDNLMSHKVAFTYYSYSSTLSFHIHAPNVSSFMTFHPTPLYGGGSPPGFHRTTVSANTGYVQATINKTETTPTTFKRSGNFGKLRRQYCLVSQINILTELNVVTA